MDRTDTYLNGVETNAGPVFGAATAHRASQSTSSLHAMSQIGVRQASRLMWFPVTNEQQLAQNWKLEVKCERWREPLFQCSFLHGEKYTQPRFMVDSSHPEQA